MTSPVTVFQSLVDALKSDRVELPENGPIDNEILSVGLKNKPDSTRSERADVKVMSWGDATSVGNSSTVIVTTESLLSLSEASSVVAVICTMFANVLVVALVTGVLTNVPLGPVLENWKRRERGKGSAVVAGSKVHLVEVGLLLRTFMSLPSPDPWSVQTALLPPTVAGGPVMVTF
jgi:hypothetical protein